MRILRILLVTTTRKRVKAIIKVERELMVVIVPRYVMGHRKSQQQTQHRCDAGHCGESQNRRSYAGVSYCRSHLVLRMNKSHRREWIY